ncbi:MAG: hypothetical protein ACP6IU_10800 [Candidatus Asgardarchaeia archaeon]
MTEYSTIRIPTRVKEKIKIFARKIGAKSLSEAIEKAIDTASKEHDKFRGNIDIVLQSLKKAKSIGITDAKKVDVYLYGEKQ